MSSERSSLTRTARRCGNSPKLPLCCSRKTTSSCRRRLWRRWGGWWRIWTRARPSPPPRYRPPLPSQLPRAWARTSSRLDILPSPPDSLRPPAPTNVPYSTTPPPASANSALTSLNWLRLTTTTTLKKKKKKKKDSPRSTWDSRHHFEEHFGGERGETCETTVVEVSRLETKK